MTRSTKNSIGARALLVLALGAAALLALGGVASAKDRNHDRIPDRWEHAHHLSLKVNQAHRDQDRDHLRNMAEFKAGDNPRDDDSDNDGVEDGDEGAGTIASFDSTSGKLVINLFGGETLSGQVSAATEIKCEDEHSHDSSSASTSSGEPEPGDDHGGAANCTSADLIAGAVVQEAHLEASDGSAVFDEVELAG